LHQNRVVIPHFIARSSISNMAAAAILKFGLHLRFCDFQTEHVFLVCVPNLHQNRVAIAHFIARSSISNMAAAAILNFGLPFRHYEF
jgi:predicted XRE-type DNA-binding protein